MQAIVNIMLLRMRKRYSVLFTDAVFEYELPLWKKQSRPDNGKKRSEGLRKTLTFVVQYNRLLR